MRELRAALLGMIGEGTREIQAEEQDEDVEAADFSMKAAVARHLHDLLGGDDSPREWRGSASTGRPWRGRSS
jgi:hypothetical protein